MTHKYCNKCKETKDLINFSKNKSKKDGLASSCKECTRKMQNNYYKNNPQYYKDKARKKVKDIKEFLKNLKNLTPCFDCGISYPYYVMDFDHLKDKLFVISDPKTINNFSLSKIKVEIEKCQIVCSNCHRERTQKRIKNKC